MILVTLLKRGEKPSGFICAGHAEYREAGRDIVCAAVSALTTACVNALESVAHTNPAVRRGEGFLAARLPKGDIGRDAEVLLYGMEQGLRDIEAQYPTYIRIKLCAESERRK